MLTASFCCFRGVSEAAERRWWSQGCLDWQHFERRGRDLVSAKKYDAVCAQISEARIAHRLGMCDYFLNRLRGVHRARVYSEFRERVLYLDVETTGLKPTDHITTVVVYSEGTLHSFVRGQNLSAILHLLCRGGLLVTYNGTRFDVPLLRSAFSVDLAMPHLDLAPVLRAMGCRGGLKAAERQLRCARHGSVGVNGAHAAELWRAYRQEASLAALESLLRYNAEDALSLERILIRAYNESMSSYPLRVVLEEPDQPQTNAVADQNAL